ncbi:serine racemase VanT catalytic subunit [Paenibacillus harenae]|uniref:serine racemase VanT catalytic subunit n=1 Tax=Paenibacillus harenae TaxID=306543 RepID=UPI002794D74A|nr:serine racemase VanT catalytic subunit [Paenibacillus harenae]MDQ0062202.1 serine/alanine racemase [Paenibacillus harenae]
MIASQRGRAGVNIDGFKLVAALLVIAVHTGPLMTYSPQADFLLTGIIARLAVPFFFIASGYFLFRKAMNDYVSSLGWKPLHRFAFKTAKLYGIAIVIYIPLNLYTGYFTAAEGFSPGGLVRDLVFNGTFYHLWYLPASILGMYIAYALYRSLSLKATLTAASLLYMVGLFGDSYYGLTASNDTLSGVYDGMFAVFDYTRNGVFFTPLYFALGALAAHQAVRHADGGRGLSFKANFAGFAVSMALLFAEGMTLRGLEWPRHDSMYLLLAPSVYFLFQCLLIGKNRLGISKSAGLYMRQLSAWIYILHPALIVAVRFAAKATGLADVFVANSLVHYLAVSVLSVAVSMLVVYAGARRRRRDAVNHEVHAVKHRAWAEISLTNVRHNLSELKRVLPGSYAVIAVVKANAYGHGSVRVSQHLSALGVKQFAVADIEEAIALRNQGVRGDILILGYTSPSRAGDLKRFKLTQTLVSAEYGRQLDACGKRLRVHVKIDTGMNRLGVLHDDMDRLLDCYKLERLTVTGTFSHLSVSDSRKPEHITFTHKQLQRFDHALAVIRAAGFDPGVVHMQSSYGILNYPYREYDAARPGIALYGVMSNEDDALRSQVDLRPALSLKATVTQVKAVEAYSPVGYGHSYVPERDVRIATISIGYADGIPRELSVHGGYVLIHGQRAPIKGIICMDQMIVDVTHIKDVQQGDTATIIGQDGSELITAGQLAKRCGTLTNEILSRLGSRIVRVYTQGG